MSLGFEATWRLGSSGSGNDRVKSVPGKETLTRPADAAIVILGKCAGGGRSHYFGPTTEAFVASEPKIKRLEFLSLRAQPPQEEHGLD